jgi:hypothetical protein
MIFHGAHAGISGYGLSLEANQYSISSIWVESGPPTELNSIKVGVGVSYFYLHLCRGFFPSNFMTLHSREREYSFLKCYFSSMY